jgi:hypothetical protein
MAAEAEAVWAPTWAALLARYRAEPSRWLALWLAVHMRGVVSDEVRTCACD